MSDTPIFPVAPGIGGGAAGSVAYTLDAHGNAGAAETFDADDASHHTATLNAATCAFTLAASSAVVAEMVLELTQDSSGGRLATWPVNAVFAGGLAPTLSVTPGDVDVFSCVTVNSGVTWLVAPFGIGFYVPAVPDQVTSLAVVPGDTTNALSWATPAANGSPISAYKVYRSTAPGTETLYQTLGVVTSYSDTGLTNGTTYYYKVSAVNGVGEGALSSEASGMPAAFGNGAHYLNLTGVTPSHTATPDGPNNSFAADWFGFAKVRLTDWTPAVAPAIFCKWNGAANANQEVLFYVDSGGLLNLAWNTGALFKAAASSAAVGAADGTDKWIGVTFLENNGAAGSDVKFYTSNDGVAWTQLGTTQTVIGVAGQQATALELDAGGRSNDSGVTYDTNLLIGRLYALALGAGTSLAGTQTTTVDFSVQTAGAGTFVATSGETWTVTAPASII